MKFAPTSCAFAFVSTCLLAQKEFGCVQGALSTLRASAVSTSSDAQPKRSLASSLEATKKDSGGGEEEEKEDELAELREKVEKELKEIEQQHQQQKPSPMMDSSSSSEQITNTTCSTMILPCRARGMPMDHNVKVSV